MEVNLNNLAACLFYQDKTDEAESQYRQALAMKQRLLGSSHSDVAMTLNNMAVLYKRQGRFDEADRCYAQANTIFTAQLGSHDPRTCAAMRNRDILRGRRLSTQGLSAKL